MRGKLVCKSSLSIQSFHISFQMHRVLSLCSLELLVCSKEENVWVPLTNNNNNNNRAREQFLKFHDKHWNLRSCKNVGLWLIEGHSSNTWLKFGCVFYEVEASNSRSDPILTFMFVLKWAGVDILQNEYWWNKNATPWLRGTKSQRSTSPSPACLWTTLHHTKTPWLS